MHWNYEGEDGESLADLRVRLEENKVLKFDFQCWDPDECCRVATSLESFTDLEDKVFMIPALYEEVEDFACKQQRLEGVYLNQSNEVENMVQHPLIVDIGGNNEILADPPSYSRVSGSSEENLLQSQIVTIEVMAMYIEGEGKLCKILKGISLEDHKWDLNLTIVMASLLWFFIVGNAIRTLEGLMGNTQRKEFQFFFQFQRKSYHEQSTHQKLVLEEKFRLVQSSTINYKRKEHYHPYFRRP